MSLPVWFICGKSFKIKRSVAVRYITRSALECGKHRNEVLFSNLDEQDASMLLCWIWITSSHPFEDRNDGQLA